MHIHVCTCICTGMLISCHCCCMHVLPHAHYAFRACDGSMHTYIMHVCVHIGNVIALVLGCPVHTKRFLWSFPKL